MRFSQWLAGACLVLCTTMAFAADSPFSAKLAGGEGKGPQQGRLMLLFSNDDKDEPRNQVDLSPKTQVVFGMNVENFKRGDSVAIAADAQGYPVDKISDLKPGTYTVQALLNRYETFHRADGHTISLPPDQGEGQHWNLKPGNAYSKPRKVTIGEDGVPAGGHLELVMDQTIPPIKPLKDTKYVRHIRIQSAMLTKFWGRPMFLSAAVLVPDGFDQHPKSRFPLIIFHDHFVPDFDGFRTTPPDPNLKPDYSDRFHLSGYNRVQQEEAYTFYQQWTSKNFPRVLIVKLQHANPFYDDSYAVDSLNVGPYGSAIEQELIPAIEKKFRALGTGWSRFVYGGSTGGWESLAVQVFHPDFYNGAFVACPDPVDFHALMHIDLYDDPNALYWEGTNMRIAQPAMRDYLGRTLVSMPQNMAYELALGDRGRSTEQWDIWQAVYSPVGDDGYPKPIFDKKTGVIDHDVATYWREHWDLAEYLRRNWPRIGKDLQGKLHIYVGLSDSYFLNDAVYRLEDALKSFHDPAYDGEVTYGQRDEHCWNGDPTQPNYLSRLHYNTQYLPKIVERIEKTAPAGADLTSWRY
ncbi:MAG TPA: alpha/beta hydrolase-fold protein [Rudaea sp.]|nr:alpha/beta hydrolase-fold protein [Rudaea sp.]